MAVAVDWSDVSPFPSVQKELMGVVEEASVKVTGVLRQAPAGPVKLVTGVLIVTGLVTVCEQPYWLLAVSVTLKVPVAA